MQGHGQGLTLILSPSISQVHPLDNAYGWAFAHSKDLKIRIQTSQLRLVLSVPPA